MKVKIVRKKKSREVLRCINVNLNSIIKNRTFYVCSCSKSSHCCAK